MTRRSSEAAAASAALCNQCTQQKQATDLIERDFIVGQDTHHYHVEEAVFLLSEN